MQGEMSKSDLHKFHKGVRPWPWTFKTENTAYRIQTIAKKYDPCFKVQKQLLLSVHLSHRNSVCPSVCHTGGSVKNGL